ncbi:MAG TPA: hypothetical protein VD905_00625, partial [Flavobacteriales bacterium]|nr:hypothetical protein [Flavobacteriales bacterium]
MKIKTGLCLTLSALLLAQAVGAQQEFEIRIQKLVLNDIASMDEDDMFFKWTLVDGQNNEDIVLFRKKNKDSVMLFHANGKNMSLMGEATWYDDYGRLRCRSYFDYNPAMHAVQKSAPVYPHARSYLTFWGSKQGKEEVFYDNNNDTTAKDLPLFRVSFYKDGKKEGTETEYWKNGNVIRSAEWNNDSMHGAFFENYEHGSKSKAGNYANDRMEGWWYTWYEDGSLKSKTKYTADKPDTVYTYYRGGILSTVNFNPQRYSYKPSFSYDSLGRLMQFAYMNAQREFDSIEVGYYKNGQKEYEVNVKTGKWDGAYTAWYSNGKIKEKGQYKNSIPYGNWFYYDAKGKLLKTK